MEKMTGLVEVHLCSFKLYLGSCCELDVLIITGTWGEGWEDWRWRNGDGVYWV